MGYTATYPRQRKTHPTAKNRVWGFFAESNKARPANRLQPSQPRREIDPTATKPVSGVFFYGYRYYDPVTGRWQSRDPIGERGGLNVYGFLKNNGLSSIDVLGLEEKKEAFDWQPLYDKINEGGIKALEDSENEIAARQKAFDDLSVEERTVGVRPSKLDAYEYCGRVCRHCDPETNKVSYYITETVTQKLTKECDPTQAPTCKDDDSMVGIYHNHPPSAAARLSGFGPKYKGDKKVSDQGKPLSRYSELEENQKIPPKTPIGGTSRDYEGKIQTDLYNPRMKGGRFWYSKRSK